MSKIAILFPTTGNIPRGGFKVLLQYANLLAREGHIIDIYYPLYVEAKTNSLLHTFLRKLKAILVGFITILVRGYKCEKWFPLNQGIKENLVYSLNSSEILYHDIYIATAAVTAKYLLNIKSSRRYYFIQGYEPWMMSESDLIETYRYPVRKIVVSKWLHDLLKSYGVESEIVQNGFDSSEYGLDVKIEDKNSHKVSMLYHTMPQKNISLGFEVLSKAKMEVPDLTVSLFGVFDMPENLPSWYKYYKSPSLEVHRKINNEAAIYLGTSDNEGYGLTVGEAMMCGQAVACTNNKGFLEMAENQETALVSPTKNVDALTANLLRLLRDDNLRCHIAQQGFEHIQSFTMEQSFSKLKKILEL